MPESADAASFASLGVCEVLCESIEKVGWVAPTEIQREALPLALSGHDVIGLAETGSGKTAAFVLPILQSLLAKQQKCFALILAPTKELALQTNDQVRALGSRFGVESVAIIGGVSMPDQAQALKRGPHIIVATPGRLADHLRNTRGFALPQLKFLVLDEADKMLGEDFESVTNTILEAIPKERQTFLFSATMTKNVRKLQMVSLHDPVKVEVSSKYQTVRTLIQHYLFIPDKYKDCYLVYLLTEFAGQSAIVFVATRDASQKLALLLRNLGFQAVCMHGQMTQPKRQGALQRFKAGERNVLIATDVAARGLDIPSVDLVLNYDVPNEGTDYIHRVGRTARAGRAGRAITLVTQYDIEPFQRIEKLLERRLDKYAADESTVLVLMERVTEAERFASLQMREMESKQGRRRHERGGRAPSGERGGRSSSGKRDGVGRDSERGPPHKRRR